MKPYWKDAPEWAQWLASDFDGQWYWYQNQPSLDYGGAFYWAKEGGQYDEASKKSSPPWDKAPILERRP